MSRERLLISLVLSHSAAFSAQPLPLAQNWAECISLLSFIHRPACPQAEVLSPCPLTPGQSPDSGAGRGLDNPCLCGPRHSLGTQAVFGGPMSGADLPTSPQAQVHPRCGRLVVFSSGGENPHGVWAVTRGRRCALALWHTWAPEYREQVRSTEGRGLTLLGGPGVVVGDRVDAGH